MSPRTSPTSGASTSAASRGGRPPPWPRCGGGRPRWARSAIRSPPRASAAWKASESGGTTGTTMKGMAAKGGEGVTGKSGRPAWLTVRAPSGDRVEAVSGALARHGLRTVCGEARCPNVGDCWGNGAATVILLGGVCTRGCAFCGVAAGRPAPPDPTEPERVALAAADLGWRHVVVTSVARDDLAGGGAAHFSETVAALRRRAPGATVELLVP